MIPRVNSPAAKAFAKVRAESVSTWKKHAWKQCSIYNRRKDADENGYVACCTCGTVKHWKEMDAGHFRPGRYNSILFCDRGIHAQCKSCNGRLNSCTIGAEHVDRAYEEYMRKRYGQSEIDRIDYLRSKTTSYTVNDLKALTAHYEAKVKAMQ